MNLSQVPTFEKTQKMGYTPMDALEELDTQILTLTRWLTRLLDQIQAYRPSGSYVRTIGTVNANSVKTFTESFFGAQNQSVPIGSPVLVGFSLPLTSGLIIPLGQITAKDVVTWYVANVTGAPITMSVAGTLNLIPVIP